MQEVAWWSWYIAKIQETLDSAGRQWLDATDDLGPEAVSLTSRCPLMGLAHTRYDVQIKLHLDQATYC